MPPVGGSWSVLFVFLGKCQCFKSDVGRAGNTAIRTWIDERQVVQLQLQSGSVPDV